MILAGETRIGTKFSFQDHEYTRIEDMVVTSDSFGNICLLPSDTIIDNAWLDKEDPMPDCVIQVKCHDGGVYYARRIYERYYICTRDGNLLYNDMLGRVEALFTQYRHIGEQKCT